MTMLQHPIPQSLRSTTYQPPTTANVVTVRPSKTRRARRPRKRVSEAEYWEKYYDYVGPGDHQYEWNNGYLEEKPMPDHVSYLMYDWLVALMKEYLRARPIAKVIGLEMAFRFVLPHKVAIRKPDLGVVLETNPVLLGPHDQSYRGVFDICIESLSYSTPGEVKRDTVTKKREYAQAGVAEYYILDSRGTRTRFYQLTPGGVYAPIPSTPDGLIASAVLPGFQFRLTDLFRRPSIQEMSQDSVYQSFVGLDLQEERRKVAAAEQRAAVAEAKLRQLEMELAQFRRSK